MAKAKRLSGLVMTRVARLLSHDYQRNFVRRYEHAARLRSKRRPGKTADQIRNAMDHFALALAEAMEFDSKLRLKKARPKGKRSRRQTEDAIELNLARAKKHFIVAQFYCLRYAVAVRHQDIDRLLKLPQAQGKNQFDDLRKEIRMWRGNWEPILEPQSDKTEQIAETLRETRRLRTANSMMEGILDDLENLLADLAREIRKYGPL